MLKEKLLSDLKTAMKEKNVNRKNAVQMVRTAILQIEKDKGIEVTDEQIIEIIAKEVKKRKDSLPDFERANRQDLIDQINEEISALEEYLPKQLTDEELASLDDEDIKVPLERYISIMSAGYFGGKAPTYKIKAFNEDKDKIIRELFNHETNDEQEIKEIEELIKHIVDYNNDGSHFLHMVLDYLVKRACYEIYYKTDTCNE